MMTRPAEHLVYGLDGPGAWVHGRVCAQLTTLLNLNRLRAQLRGQDPQLDQTLLAIQLAGIAFQSFGSATVVATEPQPVARSVQQLNDTVSTTIAAEIANMTDAGIRRAIREKRLKATVLDARYRINREDLAHFIANR